MSSTNETSPAPDRDSGNQEQSSEVATVTNDNQQAQADQDAQPTQQPPRTSFMSFIRNCIFNMVVVWFLTRTFLSPNRGSVNNTNVNKADMKLSRNLFDKGFMYDLYVYVSEDSYEPDFFNKEELRWVQKGLKYDDWTQGPSKDSSFQTNFDIAISPKVQNNGSLWLHSYVVKPGNIPYEATRSALNFDPIYTVHKKKQLNRYKKRRYRDTHNLLTGRTDKSEEEQDKIKAKIKEEVISHWHPNLTINMIYDFTAWSPGSVPAPLDEFIDFEPKTGRYYPIIYMNDYWNLLRDYYPINETVKTVHLNLNFQPISMIKWQLYASQGLRNKWSNMLGSEAMENEEEQDYIKEALLETSPILLGLTVIVSIAHSVFEFLAFKNDIQFWRERKSLEGLSVRSVFFNLFQSLVVLLYVLDNDTSTLIKISIGIGLLIELWKIPKVTNIVVNRDRKILGIIPRITFEDKGSYVESSTKQYDMLAYKYLSWAVFPLFVAYAIYSLIYQEHKGWYSFILNMTYGFLLAFGFIMMTPQLFINYKLKSVAHLPWRMLSYKFLNTFIDDIFAFVIKMPLMYRIGCFRDDIIFIIYLYQRWIYRVDPKRVNEFGISGEDLQNPPIVASKTQAAAIEAPVKKSRQERKQE